MGQSSHRNTALSLSLSLQRLPKTPPSRSILHWMVGWAQNKKFIPRARVPQVQYSIASLGREPLQKLDMHELLT